jgi:acetylornithine deacetylase/succinyl-diaminopimelate desuccinylase-like protein
MKHFLFLFILHVSSFCFGQKEALDTENNIIAARRITIDTRSFETFVKEQREKQIKELAEFLAIPSISSLPAHKNDMVLAAEWLARKLKAIGMTETDVITAGGHPVVFSKWNKATGKPTVLIYGHYDVQPVKEEEWKTPPFVATTLNERIYARGAADDKGGLMIAVWAVEGILKTGGSLPVNLIFLFDGEEEKGSPNFKKFLQTQQSLPKVDFAYNADGAQFNDSTPSIWMSLRGSLPVEFEVRTATVDAHSGIYGGKTPNAAKAAAQIIASFYTPDDKVAIKHFYDRVLPLSKKEKDMIKNVPYDEKKDEKDLGTTVETGDHTHTPLERLWYRPTLEVTGVWGGYTAAEGFANIIPASVRVRLNCRTVANQEANEITHLIIQHILQHSPRGVTITFKDFEGYSMPIKFPATGPAFQAAYDVLANVYKKPPLLTAIGGSIGALTDIKEVLGVYTYSFGFQQADENFHAPNEFIRISDIEKGQTAYYLLLKHISNEWKK